MAASKLRILREALAGFLKQFGCQLKVALGGIDVNVAEVGRQLWEQALDVLAGSIPRKHPMHGRGVSQIM
jgi:hypothetical protein